MNINTHDAGLVSRETMPKGKLRLIILAVILLSTIGCDQSTKFIAKSSLKENATIAVMGNYFVLRYVENKGAFLSVGATLSDPIRKIVFVIIPLLVICGAIIYAVSHRSLTLPRTSALSLMIGGGIGNLIDRLLRDGSVVDFMNLGIGWVRTGIFNFADVFLMIGVALFILFSRNRKVESHTT